MSERPIALLLGDMLEATRRIGRYTADMSHDAFVADDKTKDAVARNLEIIGEAASRLPDGFRAQHPEIEWRKIIGLRHRIVHHYFGLDVEIVWVILQRDLPRLGEQLAALTAGTEAG